MIAKTGSVAVVLASTSAAVKASAAVADGKTENQ